MTWIGTAGQLRRLLKYTSRGRRAIYTHMYIMLYTISRDGVYFRRGRISYVKSRVVSIVTLSSVTLLPSAEVPDKRRPMHTNEYRLCKHPWWAAWNT